jgi:hypothetical protein
MFRGGAVLRLIDVCFNILIGFICITDRDIRSRLNLPTSESGGQNQEIVAVVDIRVAVDPTRVIYAMRTPPDGSSKEKESHPIPSWFYQISWERNGVAAEQIAPDASALKNVLTELLNQNVKIEQVVVASDDQSPVGSTVVVYDVCKELRLPAPAIDLTMEDGE